MKIFRFFLISGIVIWILAHILVPFNFYPLNFILFYFAPCLLLIGVLIWLIEYLLKNKSFPNPIKVFYDEKKKHWGPFSGTLVLRKYFLEWIIIWFAIWMVAVHWFMWDMRNSIQYKRCRNYVEESKELRAFIGNINGYSFYIGSEFPPDVPGYSCRINFKVYGERKKPVQVEVTMENVDKEYNWQAVSYRIY